MALGDKVDTEMFIKFGSGFQNLLRIYTHTDSQTHRQQGVKIILVRFFKWAKPGTCCE